ncbi:Glucan endo-1,3-beta-glucosidase [Cardamine amara subsp. amara]|uniref:Glucan endo-1,3-beta-glucosidase n=1 Tax=Cardamine amara subsp. amara TaxID=228776 RepID=A0ABD0ZX70_CARAN
MDKAQICLSFVIFLYISSEGSFMRVNASQGQWCVARPGTEKEKLEQLIQIFCRVVDCKIISEGGECYTPDNLINMASVAMNLYYQAKGRMPLTCQIGAAGYIAVTDPSYGNCIYEFKQ